MSRTAIPYKVRKTTPGIITRKELGRREYVEKQLETKATLRVPSDLSPVAKKEWRRLIGLYREMEMEILSDLDRNALATYCEAYSIYHMAQQEWVEIKKVTSDSEVEQVRINKIFRTMEKQSIIMARYAEQLCLTPVGRAKMGVANKNKPTRLEEMVARAKR